MLGQLAVHFLYFHCIALDVLWYVFNFPSFYSCLDSEAHRQLKVAVLKGRGGRTYTNTQLTHQVMLCARSNTRNMNRIQLTDGTRMWTIKRQHRAVNANCVQFS